jgi:hypothetical protein
MVRMMAVVDVVKAIRVDATWTGYVRERVSIE